MTTADFLQSPFPPATALPGVDLSGPGRFWGYQRETPCPLPFSWFIRPVSGFLG